MKLYYFYTLKQLWDGQGKIKMYLYYGMSRVKKQLSGKRSITFSWNVSSIASNVVDVHLKLSWKPLTVFTKSSIIDVRLGFNMPDDCVQFANMKLISDGFKNIEKWRHPSALVNHGKEFHLDIASAVG